MPKDNVDLICDVAELTTLFERSQSLDDFLQTVVSVVAWHMKAAVCSIYLYDESNEELVLRANQGLKSEAVGSIRLALGEGITGSALRELRPIRVGRAKDHPHYRYFPDIEEEKYEAFLAVPILRGLRRLGALVVQDTQVGYFEDTDAKALRAIAAQLASVIESASLLMDLRDQVPAPGGGEDEMRTLSGQSANSGIARGHALFIDRSQTEAWAGNDCPRGDQDVKAFRQALKETESQLSELQQKMEEELSDVASLIFSAHLLILKDDSFAGRIESEIENGLSACEAINLTVNEYVRIFSNSTNPRLKEKVHDIKDLQHRLLHNLMDPDPDTNDYSDRILVAEEFLPSDILRFAAEGAAGLITQGGVTAHSAILCRSMQIPMVLLSPGDLQSFKTEDELLMDADHGMVFVHPDSKTLTKYAEYEHERPGENWWDGAESETYTKDGERIRLMASINLLNDLKSAEQARAEGVGLYRSEFPFIVRNDFPSEEEQYAIYRKIVEQVKGREVIFRTLDIGGDKMLSYYSSVNESNPFLGLRAIRFSLQHRDVFGDQLRAFLRAGALGPIRIMFPLIASLDEFIEARDIARECARELEAEGVAHGKDVPIGIMIELPSAVELVNDLAREADFLSIGTNDLIQYMLAVDRTNESVSQYYQSRHPAVLRALSRIAAVAKAHRRDLLVCGDITMDQQLLPFLLGLGIRTFSLSPKVIPSVQRQMASTSMNDAEALARELLPLNTIAAVEQRLKS